MTARGLFLHGDSLNAYYNLGVALHYIQDSYTSVVSYNSPNRQMWHQNWEQNIQASSFVNNLDIDLEKAINFHLWNREAERERCLWLVSVLCREAQGKDQTLYAATLSGNEPSPVSINPTIDLNLGLIASYTITKSVLSPKNNPALETQLKYILSQHETFLLNAEVDLSNKIISLIEERDYLKTMIAPPTGIVCKIKNWITGVKIGRKEKAAISKYYDYVSRRHLLEVANNYLSAANTAVAPHFEWYNFVIPPINIGMVKKDLISVQDITGYLGVSEYAVKEILKKGNAPSCSLGNNELVRRPEINRVLSQFPLNGFKEYPI